MQALNSQHKTSSMKQVRNLLSGTTRILAICLFISACQSEPAKTEAKPSTDSIAAMQTSDSTSHALEHLLVDNKKDPSCGMPVTAGISDTAHYKEKVLGFCSKECKESFLKDPETMIAAAELKK